MKYCCKGFTLIEVIVYYGLAAFILSLAFSSFASLSLGLSELQVKTEEFQAAFINSMDWYMSKQIEKGFITLVPIIIMSVFLTLLAYITHEG